MRPLSLRQVGAAQVSHALRRDGANVSAVALACIAATFSHTALAQTADGGSTAQPQQQAPSTSATPLPALKVETTSAKPKVKKQSASKAATPPLSPAAPPSGATAEGKTPPGGNPYADPNAPYKVDRSANTKLTQPLVDTPRTVTTISKEVMQDKQVTSIRELARQTPGVTLGTGEGGNAFGDVLFIRGFKASNDAYIDGVRDSGVTVRENFMTEQVEILKGPSSSVGGRGTTGGAINLVTKKPQEQNFGVVSTTVGTDATRRATVDINQVIDPTLAVRMNGMWQEADVAGRDDVFDNRWGGAVAADWKPTDAFKLTVDYYHIQMHQMPDWGVPWDRVNNRPYSESGLDRSTFYGVLDRDFMKPKQDIGTVTGELKLSDNVTLTNKVRRGRSINDYVLSAPSNANAATGTVSSSPKSRYQRNDILADQTDVTSKFDTGVFKHTLVTGVEISSEKVMRDTYRSLDTESNVIGNIPGCTVSLFHPDTSNCFDSNDELVLTGNPTHVDVLSRSIYALDTIKLSPSIIVTAGARIDDYNIKLVSPTSNLARSDTMFNWNGGVTWKPLSFGSIYFAYGTSTNPMGQELDAGGGDYGGLDAGGELLAPEKNKSIEVGTKWEVLNRGLLLTGALFKTTKTNARENGTNGAVYDSGAYEVRGVELSAAGNIASALSIYGGAVFMDSEVTESRVASNIGRRFSNIAHTQFNLLAKYKVVDWFSIGGQATYGGEKKGGTFADNGNVLPDYWRFDALAEIKVSDSVEVQLNGVNLTNELYYDAFYRSNAPYVYVAPGRAGYLTVRFKY